MSLLRYSMQEVFKRIKPHVELEAVICCGVSCCQQCEKVGMDGGMATSLISARKNLSYM